jgi:polar amino acid transport system substrate-binding protein
MKKLFTFAVVVIAGSLLLAACGAPPAPTEAPAPAPTTAPPAAAPTEAPAPDLLSTIMDRGTLVVSSDPAYPPQSALKASPARTDGTKCASDQQTLGELEGFDIDVAAAIAEGLGVEVCFVTPAWDLIVAGNWAGRWDISVGSITITPERAEVLYFPQPYYTTPAALFVHADNTTYTQPADLSGKRIGVCAACTYESYLNGTLEIPGETIEFVVEGADVKTYDTDTTALEDLSLGDGVRLDAVLTAQPTGLGIIADGRPLKQLGEPVYFEYLAPGVDRSSSLDPATFIAKVTEIVAGLHADGTLLGLSQTWYGTDLTSAAATFDAAPFSK